MSQQVLHLEDEHCQSNRAIFSPLCTPWNVLLLTKAASGAIAPNLHLLLRGWMFLKLLKWLMVGT